MKLKDYLDKNHACSEAVEWAGDKPVEQVVADCHRGDWLLWLAVATDVEHRLLILVKGHCANTVRHLMTDERSTAAVDASIAFGKGDVDVDELNAACAAADTAAYVAAGWAVASAAYAAAATADTDTADTAAYTAASAADAASAVDADYTADTAAAAKKENQAKTADICRKYIGKMIIDEVNKKLKQNR